MAFAFVLSVKIDFCAEIGAHLPVTCEGYYTT